MPLKPIYINSPAGRQLVDRLCSRFELPDNSCRDAVREIIGQVKKRGDEALAEYGRKFDSPRLTAQNLQVSADELENAYQQVDKKFLKSLARAIDRIEVFHQREMEDSWLQTRENGTVVGRLVRPVDSAGLYVPGGQGGSTPLVSSVLMNGIPVAIAGVAQRVMVTPPNKQGLVNPHLLVAAQEIGITHIYKAGSAWGIAALAHGTSTIPKVDVIAGPGNRFVAEAKRQVSQLVKIDMIAGPSEVLIVADHTASAAYAAADMLAQAEHDPQALAVVITTEPGLAADIAAELDRQLPSLSRQEIAAKAIADRGLILLADTIREALDIANRLAIEHLELMIDDPWSVLPLVKHAGAIFLGKYTPEAAGDYLAGPNHVLPTMGTARFASALGVETFLKKSSIISYSQKALEDDAEDIIRLAELEALTAHAGSVRQRIKR
ncbi:MAG: histidinol dehydrogenase [Deltaproteobacteria bacterium]|nr:MAG: histidinol dehydrogenase [Deltaproteobacteria bacterium]